MTKYQEARNTKRSYRNLVGKLRGGKLVPVMAEAVRPSEGGMISQRVTMMLDPIPGRLITEITAEFHAVFVPVQAIDAIKDPGAAYAGLTDVIREKLLSGTPLFALETENEISKRCGVVPRSVSGVKRVNEAVRLAHNAAVNYLRMRKYNKASLLLHTNMSVTPAILSQTVLDRLNSVLDPEDRVNGMVEFQTGVVTAPVHAGGRLPFEGVFMGETSAPANLDNLDGTSNTTAPSASSRSALEVKRASFSAAPNPVPGATLPPLSANLTGLNIGSISLTDMYEAERMDDLVREMRLVVDRNPEYGEEMLLNWVHGLTVEGGNTPWTVAERKATFFKATQKATDTEGVETDVMRTDGMVEFNVQIVVPKTELGGIVITFLVLKPDETLASQPHPILSDVWTVDNFVADELKIDPVPITYREVFSEVAAGDEALVSSYGGNNHLKLNYVHYGFNRQVDPNTVENKAAIWQLNIPMSVSPQSVLYPDYLDHGVFAFGGTALDPVEVCTYNIESTLTLATPMIVGPTPVEELAYIETADLFDDN